VINNLRIFISIVSYRDKLLEATIRAAVGNATHPNRLTFGIVEQNTEEDSLDKSLLLQANIRYMRIDPTHSRGVSWARNLAMSFYQGETFYFQIDSHMIFDKGWDEYFVDYYFACQLYNPNCVISGYPHPFKFIDGVPTRKPTTPNVLVDIVSEDFKDNSYVLKFKGHPLDKKEPVMGFHVAGGCLFALGKFVEYFPYDAQMYFHGEEQLCALRLYTHGWDIFHTPHLPVYHLYETSANPTRPKHWDKTENEARAEKWNELSAKAELRLRNILFFGRDCGVYNLGSKRSIFDYAKQFGIDYFNKTIEERARKV
jgi:hypothetical protein